METPWGKVEKLQIPPLQEEGRGQQLNINELTIGTLQVSTFEFHLEKTKQLLLSQIQSFKAGSISKCYSRWLDLTLDPEVLSTVKGQLIEFTSTPYQHRVPTQRKFSAEESSIIQSEIDKLLQKKVIVPARNEPGQFISTIFLRPKPGSNRMILNLKQLNKSVEYEHFKMDTLWIVITRAPQGIRVIKCNRFPRQKGAGHGPRRSMRGPWKLGTRPRSL